MRSDLATRLTARLLFALWIVAGAAPSTEAAKRSLRADDLVIGADTASWSSLDGRVSMTLMLADEQRKLTEVEPYPKLFLVRDGRVLAPHIELQVLRRGVQAVIPLDESTLGRLQSFGDMAQAELRCDRPFYLGLDNGDRIHVTPETLGEATRGRWPWAADSLIQLWRYLDVVQSGKFVGNFVDVGSRTATDDDGQDGAFATRFSISSRFLMRGNAFHAEGEWSTVSQDSTNHLRLDPINVRLTRPNSHSVLEFRSGVDCGRLGFTRQGRFTAGLDWKSLAPNLLDLTAGAPRFRLKPLVAATVEAFGEWSNHEIPTDDRNWGQAKLVVNYDIPVLARQLLRVEARTFCPFRRNAAWDDVGYQYSIHFMTEVAGGKFKPVISFSNGADDINQIDVTRVLIGLWFNGVPGSAY